MCKIIRQRVTEVTFDILRISIMVTIFRGKWQFFHKSQGDSCFVKGQIEIQKQLASYKKYMYNTGMSHHPSDH